jgi:hypothetical protein
MERGLTGRVWRSWRCAVLLRGVSGVNCGWNWPPGQNRDQRSENRDQFAGVRFVVSHPFHRECEKDAAPNFMGDEGWGTRQPEVVAMAC